jgi:hypothetical protein
MEGKQHCKEIKCFVQTGWIGIENVLVLFTHKQLGNWEIVK